MRWDIIWRIKYKITMIYLFTDEAQTAVVKAPVRTAQRTLFFSVMKTNQFML